LRRDAPVSFDPAEFRTMRWWSPDEPHSADATHLDPAFGRFLTKIAP
jgi:hypothetical protein